MPITLARFELPKRLVRNDDTATQTYAQFIAEPFEKGFGHSIGNSLRRVLLSAIEGAAIVNIKIDGVLHEFSTIPGVIEDVPQIILNLKKIKFKLNDTRESRKVILDVKGPGPITAKHFQTDNTVEVISKDAHIVHLNASAHFKAEFEVALGRGYRPAEKNKLDTLPVGVIPIDSIFSPVLSVKYHVEDTRVGYVTDYERLVVDVTTDGRMTPEDVVKQASAILRHHLDIFVGYDENYIAFEETEKDEGGKEKEMENLLNMSIDEIELSVRSANCIQGANIHTIRDLVTKSEAEMLKYRNFGKKSLNEIKKILTDMGLHLGMKLDELPQLEGKSTVEPEVAAETEASVS